MPGKKPNRTRRLFTRTVADATRANVAAIARKLGVSEGKVLDAAVQAYAAQLDAEGPPKAA
jgi:hypothetical protein